MSDTGSLCTDFGIPVYSTCLPRLGTRGAVCAHTEGRGGVCTRRRGRRPDTVSVCGVCVCVQSLTRSSLHARADLAAEKCGLQRVALRDSASAAVAVM